MIALLIGGTVVLCIGLLTVVFGIPIKEFSFGNTMILSGAVVSCTGLILIGLYFIGREFRNLTRRLEAGVPVPAPLLPVHEAAEPPPPRPHLPREDRLFARDQPRDRDEIADDHGHDDHLRAPPLPEPAPSTAWQDHPVTRTRPLAPPPAESFEPPAEPAERPRRNIMFSSHRRDQSRELPAREPLQTETPPEDSTHRSSREDFPPREAEPGAADPFDHAWPQSGRSRLESPAPRTSRAASPPADQDAPEPVRERFQPPRRADASSVTIVKSGVVDSMAYSLYSDGSIEAQMPEGMVRFASIDDLRAHLDERN
jgi:hypothetical protein